jgi:flagellar biosynthetic protein FliP
MPTTKKTTQRRRFRSWLGTVSAILLLVLPTVAAAQTDPVSAGDGTMVDWTNAIHQFSQPAAFSGTLKTLAALTVLSLAPAVLLMTTSFVRIAVVLGLLRQAIGAQLLPSNQIITSLAMFLTMLVMAPVWMQVYDEAIVPYTDAETQMSTETAWQIGVAPVRRFMSQQIEKAQNSDDVWLFMKYLPQPAAEPRTYDDVPFQALLPAFMLSELKVAFLIGFRIFLPFLIIDLVVASVSTSMGMMMLPPTMVSLPMKLLLFVLVDGWHLVVGMLLESFAL